VLIEEETPVPAPPTSIWGSALRSTTVGLVIVVTLVAFEAVAVSTALPTAARDLHGLAAFGWAYTGFLLANVVGLVLSGMLCDSRGARVPLGAGLVVFTTGLLVAGTATVMPVLVIGRVVQGLGGGLVLTALYVVIGQAYPERLRGQVFAATSSAWVVPSLVGPLIAGALAQHVSWRAVFLGLAPFVVLGGVLLVPVLRTLRGGTHQDGRLADPRRLLHALLLAAAIAVLEQAGQHPSLWLIAPAAAGVAALWWGLRRLVPRGTLVVAPGVSAPIALRGLMAGAFFGMESIVPLSMSEQHGYGATAAGLPLAVSGVAWAVGSWWQGRTSDEGRPRRRRVLIRVGFTLVAVAAAAMAVAVVPSVPGWAVFLAWLPAGLGAGLTMSSVGVLMLAFTTDADRGGDSAALQLADVTVSAVTTGIGGVLVAAAGDGRIDSTTAFVTIFALMAAVAGVGSLLSGRARPPAGSVR